MTKRKPEDSEILFIEVRITESQFIQVTQNISVPQNVTTL